MKPSELYKRLRLEYKFLQTIIPEDSNEWFSEDEIDEKVSETLEIVEYSSYDIAENIYKSGLVKYTQNYFENNSPLWKEVIDCGAILLQVYGLNDDDYRKWATKQSSIFSDFLFGLLGDDLTENKEKIGEDFKKYQYEKLNKEINRHTNLRSRNGIYISKDVSEEFKIRYPFIENNICFSEEFNEYNSATENYGNIITSINEEFEEDFEKAVLEIKKEAKKFPEALFQIVELFTDYLSETGQRIISLLREYECDSDSVKLFRSRFNGIIDEAKGSLLENINPLIEIYEKKYPQNQSYNHKYFDTLLTFAKGSVRANRIMNEDISALTDTLDDMASDFISYLGNSLADTVINSMKEGNYEAYFKKIILGEEFEEFLEDYIEAVHEINEEEFLEIIGIVNYNLINEYADEEILTTIIKNFFEDTKPKIDQNKIKEYLLSKVYDCPFDWDLYATIYLLYGYRENIYDIVTYLGIDEQFEESVEEKIQYFKEAYLKLPLDSSVNYKESMKKINAFMDSHKESEDFKEEIIKKEIDEYYLKLPVYPLAQINNTLKEVNIFMDSHLETKYTNFLKFYYEEIQYSRDLLFLIESGLEKRVLEEKNKLFPLVINVRDDELWVLADQGNGYAQYLLKFMNYNTIKQQLEKTRDEDRNEKLEHLTYNILRRSRDGSLTATYLYSLIMCDFSANKDKDKREMYIKTIGSIADKGIATAQVDYVRYLSKEEKKKYNIMEYIVDAEKRLNPEAFYFHAACLISESYVVRKNESLGRDLMNIAEKMGVKELI